MIGSKWVKALIAVAVLIAMGMLWLGQQRENARLHRENESLARQVEQLEWREGERNSPSNQVAQTGASDTNPQLLELLRLRNEVGMFRRQTNELRQMQEQFEQLKSVAAGAAAVSPSTNMPAQPLAVYPKESWGDVGYSTPENAFQTLNWTALNGDLNAIRVALTTEMQKDFDKEFQKKTASQLAEEIKNSFNKKSGVRILSKNEVTDHLVVLEVADAESASGGQGDRDKLVFQLIDGVWKLAADH